MAATKLRLSRWKTREKAKGDKSKGGTMLCTLEGSTGDGHLVWPPLGGQGCAASMGQYKRQ